ncbi:MAG TPA: type II toxin-antitoxin system VapC family toxin [Thermoanaerobaculia bacterium]|nr:type II toxin-antitoxin system VapC family toxin [Thermoanaerobaculia bacterium]
MIFVDSNIPMYLIGADHPLKLQAQELVERAIKAQERLVTDAEVFQKILHRYNAIARREAIKPAFDVLLGVVDEVFAIDLLDLQRARDILIGTRDLSARDSLHTAVMERHGVEQILSFDGGYDEITTITRIYK